MVPDCVSFLWTYAVNRVSYCIVLSEDGREK